MNERFQTGLVFGGMWFVWLAPFKVNTIILSIAPGLADRRLFQFQSLFWGGIELQHHLRRRPGGCNNRVATHDSLTLLRFRRLLPKVRTLVVVCRGRHNVLVHVMSGR